VTRQGFPTEDFLEDDAVKPLGARDFEQIRELAYRTFGLDLKAGKEELVSARLRKLVREGRFRSYQEYYRHIVADHTGEALASMIDALATNHTSFLREPDHFEFLRREVVPALSTRAEVEIWSAACSSGEEVWTLACVLNDALPGRGIRIAATDISNKALRIASRAVYPAESCHILPANWMSRYFVPHAGARKAYAVAPRIRAQAAFRRINLVKDFTWPRPFPVVFCRNVMIYFDRDTQEQLVRRIADFIEPGGYLFVGHAESLTRITHSLEYVRPAVYRKPKKREIKWSR
jgi:chemotaxis protein methyltransferase CheR